MPRKAKRKAPDGKTAIESPPKPMALPEGGPDWKSADPPAPGAEIPKRRGPGRPSKAEVAAREAAARASVQMKPEDTRPPVALLLGMICQVVKADAPLESEIDAVNGPACLVANKYDLGNRFVPELSLAASVFFVVMSARRRKVDKLKSEVSSGRAEEARQPSNPGPQGERENQSLQDFLHGA